MSEPADWHIWLLYLTGIEAVGAGLVPALSGQPQGIAPTVIGVHADMTVLAEIPC
jgi:hypothetical protein